jgi:prepilin-type N-terminal cleavage/methylation domain-containing protein
MRKGFTLIELLISMALLSTLTGTLFFCFGQGLRSWRKMVIKCENAQVSNIIAERIARDVRSSSAILPQSSSEEVYLRSGADTLSYRLSADKIGRRKNLSTAYLTSDGEVERLSFSYPASNEVIVTVGDYTWNVSIRN